MKNQVLNIFFTDSKRPSKPWRKNPKQRNVNFKPCTNKELFPWLTKRKKFQWIVTPRPWTITHPILIECKNVCKSCWELCTKTVTILFNILDTCWKQVLSRYYTCEALNGCSGGWWKHIFFISISGIKSSPFEQILL